MSPRRPDPNVMRAVFQTPAALDRLVDIMSGHADDNTLILKGKKYKVLASSMIDKSSLED